jgi:signal transduction histidine kinase
MNKIKNGEAKTLIEFQKEINGKFDFVEMLRFLIKQIIECLDVERCAIFKICENLETAHLIAGEPENGHRLGMNFYFNDLPAIKEIARRKEYLLISDPQNDERTLCSRELIYDKKIRAILFVPVLVQKKVIASIVIDATGGKDNFSQEDIDFCLNMANLAGLILERDIRFKDEAEERAINILGRAAAEAVHRFRNPLTAIGGLSRRLAEKIRDDHQKKEALMIVKETEKLESVVYGLLNFIKRDKHIKKEKTDINKILSESEIIVSSFTGEKEIVFDFQLDENLPLVLVGSDDAREVFSVLLKNAVESIKNQGVICVKSKLKKETIEISFTNTGGSIDKEFLDEVFNPFFTTKPGSIGLGLAVASSIIKLYKGKIEVDSDEELGLTTFTINLPNKGE